MLKETLASAIRMGGYALEHGKRKLSPEQLVEARAAHKELKQWYRFWQKNLTDESIKKFLKIHGSKVLMIIPANAAGKTLKMKLFEDNPPTIS